MQAVWVLLALFVVIVVAVPFLLLYGSNVVAERNAGGDEEPSA